MKKRAVRPNSNVFAMFNQTQITEFKEAFSIIDHDCDGLIDKDDLKDMLSSLGQTPTDDIITEMLSEAPGSINFTMFLTLIGEKMSGYDPECEILAAFESFDQKSTGLLQVDELREFLTSTGEPLTDEEVDLLFKDAIISRDGCFNYREFVKVLKHGE